MSSETLRYLERNRGFDAPIGFTELKKYLPMLSIERMVDILWICAQYDPVLVKSLMGSVGILLSHEDWEKAKAAVDYAIHFPDYIRYTERGYGQVLEEIKTTLEHFVNQDQIEFVLRIAQYTIERGHVLVENFEDSWDWVSSLENFEQWASDLKARL